MTKRTATEDDVKIGLRFRQARVEYGFTQTDLAKYFRLSAQQIQKFESGHDRIAAKMLYRMAKLCQKQMDWFTQDLETSVDTGILPNQFLLNITRIVRHIVSTNEQKKILNLVKACVDNL